MGKNAVRFKCHHCSHCCTDVVCLPTPWDVIRIARATGLRPRRFLEFLTFDEVTDVAKSDPTWLECNGQRYIMALRRDEETGCHFLSQEDKRCAIYEARPLLCRLFPFQLHETRDGKYKSFSLHGDVACPRRRDGDVTTGPLRDLWKEDIEHQEGYNRLVEVFNRRKRAGKRPADFVDLFIVERFMKECKRLAPART